MLIFGRDVIQRSRPWDKQADRWLWTTPVLGEEVAWIVRLGKLGRGMLCL